MKTEQQSIETLNQRYQELNEKRIQAETKLGDAKGRLDKLRKQAQAEFGTDDTAKLAEMLENMKQENEKMRAAYQARLDEIESSLKKVEEDFRDAG